MLLIQARHHSTPGLPEQRDVQLQQLVDVLQSLGGSGRPRCYVTGGRVKSQPIDSLYALIEVTLTAKKSVKAECLDGTKNVSFKLMTVRAHLGRKHIRSANPIHVGISVVICPVMKVDISKSYFHSELYMLELTS